MDKVGHVAAAPGTLACPIRGARPRKWLYLTYTNPKYILILLNIFEIKGLSEPQRLAS